jgi:ribonuclease HII
MAGNYSFDDLLSEIVSLDVLVAGVDEVGRGALFGSVVAAAVVAPLSDLPKLIAIGTKDSKKLSVVKRQKLVSPIKKIVTDWQIAEATVAEIDSLNIAGASLLAMQRAILQLKVTPAICLIDGILLVPNLSIPQKTVIKGDERSPLIAAASILAKVWRDNLIIDLAVKYPQYDLIANKGYPTQKHRLALQQYGTSPQHRRSFKPCSFAVDG